MDAPAIAAGFTPSSSKASSTGICASPRAPPDPSASATVRGFPRSPRHQLDLVVMELTAFRFRECGSASSPNARDRESGTAPCFSPFRAYVYVVDEQQNRALRLAETNAKRFLSLFPRTDCR